MQEHYKDLETRIQDLERLSAGAETPEVSTKRRFLLRDLEAAGFFDAEPTDAVMQAAADAPGLRSYLDAAAKLRSYYGSTIRGQYLDDTAPNSLVEGRVSLDWFRFPHLAPPGFSPQEWLAYCEFSMSQVALGKNYGEIFFSIQGKTCVLRWRMEDGIHPAICGASVAS